MPKAPPRPSPRHTVPHNTFTSCTPHLLSHPDAPVKHTRPQPPASRLPTRTNHRDSKQLKSATVNAEPRNTPALFSCAKSQTTHPLANILPRAESLAHQNDGHGHHTTPHSPNDQQTRTWTDPPLSPTTESKHILSRQTSCPFTHRTRVKTTPTADDYQHHRPRVSPRITQTPSPLGGEISDFLVCF